MHNLPSPSDSALAHSNLLVEKIVDTIRNHDGNISFRRFMEMALYEPGLGYYVSGAQKFGASGDFVTAPELSPLFSQCIASYCAQRLIQLKDDDITPYIMELGAGSGIMAATILLELERLEQLPDTYFILDLSPELVDRQQKTIEDKAPHLIHCVQWIDTLPKDKSFNGIIVGNEVLDAMPVERFTLANGTLFQHAVSLDNNPSNDSTMLVEQLLPASESFINQIRTLPLSTDPSTGYTSEFNPNISGWVESLSQCIHTGYLLLIDYGYSQQEYYHPDRDQGTLICHYRHQVHDNPLFLPGLQDITANVDFDAVADSALESGFTLEHLETQASFLIQHNLEHYFAEALQQQPTQQYQLAQQVRTLSLPSEMGEHFKVVSFKTGLTQL